MKKMYSGLDAVKIPLNTNGHTIFTSTNCTSVWTSHFDTNADAICDSQEYLPGATDVATQSWNSCPIAGAEDD
jgi:hypothetical protein